jgi:phytoene synthase
MPYAEAADYRECARLHRLHGTTYFFASRLFPREIRRQVDALYGFVRVPDEWVDNPGDLAPEERLELIDNFESQIDRGLAGDRPEHPVLRAFVDTIVATGIDRAEISLFLDAMRADVSVPRYSTYKDLEGYMRGSAAAVGLMMLSILEVPPDPATTSGAIALGNAMQMTNFLRDVGEDLSRGRVYLPQADLAEFGVTERDLERGAVTPEFIRLMKFEIGRTRDLYAEADRAIPLLPRRAQRAVLTARVLYAAILDRIEDNQYDVFSKRARTTRAEKVAAVIGLGAGRKK